MTEEEWLAGVELWPMLELVKQQAGVRKLRLLGVACCRSVGRLFTENELSFFGAEERRLDGVPECSDHPNNAANFAWQMSRASVNKAYYAALAGGDPSARNDRATWTAVSEATVGPENARQCRLARCIFGNPFRHVTLDSAYRIPAVVSLARAAYDERQLPSGELDPHRLAVLADALEEADEPGELVDHLRSPGPHVRGCWAVDLCLGLS